MKILAAGDIHGDIGLARELAQKADDENVDTVILCGDLTGEDEDVNGIVGIFNKPVFIVPGNHDSEREGLRSREIHVITMPVAAFVSQTFMARSLTH